MRSWFRGRCLVRIAGLDQLMKCAERNPAGAKQHWDVAVTLSRFKDYENALSWMEQAIALNRTRMEYYQGCVRQTSANFDIV